MALRWRLACDLRRSPEHAAKGVFGSAAGGCRLLEVGGTQAEDQLPAHPLGVGGTSGCVTTQPVRGAVTRHEAARATPATSARVSSVWNDG